jgi:hypothetical protein
MAPARLPVLLTLAMLVGCTAPVEEPAPWQDRAPAGAATPPKGESDSGPTLGTPFYLWADALDEGGPANIEFSVPAQQPGAPRRDLAVVDHAELVLHSDGFVVALESLDVHFDALPGYLSDVHVRADGVTTGTVLAADPNMLHAEFDVRFVLDGTRPEDGARMTVLNEQPTRLALRVVRTGRAVKVSVVAARDASEWLIGASRVRGGPLALKLSGDLVSP